MRNSNRTLTESNLLSAAGRKSLLAAAGVAAMVALPAQAQTVGAQAEASAEMKADMNTGKKIFTGVVTGVRSAKTEAGSDVLVDLVSGSDRMLTVNLGGLSETYRNRVVLDARMDVIGTADASGVVMAERANVAGKSLVGDGIGAEEMERYVAAGEKNFTGLVDKVARGGGETTFSLTSAVGKTVQTTVSDEMVPKSEAGLLEPGARASITGEVMAANQVMADKVTVAGGAAETAAMQRGDAMVESATGKVIATMGDAKDRSAEKTRNYSGVLTGTETIDVDDKTHTVAVIKSDAGSVVRADLGSLNETQVEQLETGAEMEIEGRLDSSGMVETHQVNLGGEVFLTAR